MPSTHPRDRFDDVPRASGRVGAHRAENPGPRPLVVLLWAAVATVVLVVAGVIGFLVLSQQGSLVPEDIATAEPTAASTAELDTSYSVLVLNGTSSEGLVDDVVAQLEAAGFPSGQVTASASSATDVAETTVYYGTDADEAAARGLADALGGATVAQDETYQSGAEGAKELTVVVGLDRVSGG